MRKKWSRIQKISHWGLGLVAALAVTGLFGIARPSHAAAAAANPANTNITANNTFYAYVNTGENLDASFVKQIDNSTADANAVITISRPGAADVNCTVLAADPVSTACNFSNLTASSSGIWRIAFAHTGTADDYSWSIDVQTGSTDIPGRVWSTQYDMSQIGGASLVSNGVDFTVYYQSQFGYLYQAKYFAYNGISSTIEASGTGLVKSGGGCDPLYKSVNRNDPSYALAPTSCDASYKLFYETPASDLPTSATAWDNTTDWIKPVIAPPAISSMSFTSNTTHSRDGTISFSLANFTGPVDVQVDTNNNGSYADPGDVTIPTTATSGTVNVSFDGKDGNGQTIPDSQALQFKASINHTAEIHFLSTDVELRGGGIEVTRLNGPSGNEKVIYWDDTNFASPDSNRCSLTSQRDGTAGVDSTGGVHSWGASGCGAPNYGNFNNNVNGTWGDSRIINEWAFVPSSTQATAVLAAHTTTPSSSDTSAALADTGENVSFLIKLVPILILVPTLLLVVFKKRLLK